MALTELQIRQAKLRERVYLLRDADGLNLEVRPNGSKVWMIRYTLDGKAKNKYFGKYPYVSLAEARQQRDTYKAELAKGVNPVEREKAEQEAAKLEEERKATTIETVGLEWYTKQIEAVRSPSYAETIIARLNRYVFPKLGNKPISEVKTPDVLSLLKAIEATGHIEMAVRVKQIIGQVLRYGIANGLCEIDLTQGLKGALTPSVHKHFSTITKPSEIAKLMKVIREYNGTFTVKTALLFSAYTFQRPGEIRHAEWKEIDFDAALWRIPSAKMKMKREHLVPLARQSVELLRGIQELTGDGQYIFPSLKAPKGNLPMSENAVRAALRGIGYSNDEMTAHGFRGMASTQLNEQGYNADVIELCLAHAEGNSVRAAYNHAERLDERRVMCQEWADWLDGLNAG